MKKGILLLSVLTLSCSCFSFDFNPRISLLGSYTATKNYSQLHAGVFAIENRKFNLGLEATHKFYISKDFYINTGIRVSQFKTNVAAENQIDELLDKPYPLTWEDGYTAFSVPIQFGKDFTIGKGNRGDVFVGVSLGRLSNTFSKTHLETPFAKDSQYQGWAYYEMDINEQDPSIFFPTVDFGANFHPLKGLPNLGVGFLCSIQLNKTNSSSYRGLIFNDAKGVEYKYDLQHQQRFMNFAFSVNYTFGKLKPKP